MYSTEMFLLKKTHTFLSFRWWWGHQQTAKILSSANKKEGARQANWTQDTYDVQSTMTNNNIKND